MVSAVADGARRQEPGGELRAADRAAAVQGLQSRPRSREAVDQQDPAPVPLDVDDVIAEAAVLVGALEGAPARREREAAVPAGQVP